MKLKLLAIHYLSDGKALHLHGLVVQSVHQTGLLEDLNALLMCAVELPLVSDPIHECK